jgi:thioredoxin 1
MIELNKKNFQKEIDKGNIIIDFWAEWCGPCHALKPMFEDLSKDHKKIRFAKVNVDENPEIALEFSVRGIPTVVFLKKGEEVDRVIGVLPKEAFVERIKNHY